MRANEAGLVAHRVFIHWPEALDVNRKGNLPGTRDEYERFFRDIPTREAGDAIVTEAEKRYRWRPKIFHLQLIADELAGDGSFARLKARLLETGKWAVGQGYRKADGMTLREFFTGELEITNGELERYRKRNAKGEPTEEWAEAPPPELEQRARALQALLAEQSERGGHREFDPIQAALGIGAGE